MREILRFKEARERGIVIVMWRRKCARQQRPYGTIGVVGLGSRVRWGKGDRVVVRLDKGRC